MDSDLRRPSLHKFLKVSNTIGLTNYLLKQNTLEEVIQTTSLPNLDFLPSGKLPSSSMGILNSVKMKEFIEEVKRRYDFVFFDSPPIMGVSDASILASEETVRAAGAGVACTSLGESSIRGHSGNIVVYRVDGTA